MPTRTASCVNFATSVSARQKHVRMDVNREVEVLRVFVGSVEQPDDGGEYRQKRGEM
jgi:hypothetical protein